VPSKSLGYWKATSGHNLEKHRPHSRGLLIKHTEQKEKGMKKLVFGIALVAMVTVAFASCARHCPADDFEVQPVGGGRGVRIVRYRGNNSNVSIPPRIRTSPVTHIGNGAFGHRNLTSVTIPDSVTHIGNDAFASNRLTSITIPNRVTVIGDSAFQGNQLTSVTIPNNVTTIGAFAFGGNQLASVTFGNGVTYIGWEAFRQNRLTSITFGNNVATIRNGAFLHNQLTSITFPSSVTTIEDNAFRGNRLTSVTIPSHTSMTTRAVDRRGGIELVSAAGSFDSGVEIIRR